MTSPLVRIALVMGVASACTGPTYDNTVPFDPDPPEVYVAKVKNILVGLPPTDAELAAVIADPGALPGLIDTWMALPQYQQKMMVFFELAFQQTQISSTSFVDIAPPNGLGNGREVPLLVQNASESFARTALSLSAANEPFTATFTTKKLMMTTALMQLYAYLDTHQADDDGNIADAFAIANKKLVITVQSAGTFTPVNSTTPGDPNFMHFINPELLTQNYAEPDCKNVDPITVSPSSFSVFEMMYGAIPNHKVGTTNCPNRAGNGGGTLLAPSDFTDWKLVTIRQPVGAEPTTAFYDLKKLRGATELVSHTPRVGFLTPAFMANWPTNASNQMRVTVNQALIVATGTQVDGTDGTTPGMTPGIDPAHASSGACYGCHQLLDPTRSILSSTYSWFYSQQTEPALMAQPGLFAFQHVIAPMATIDDFARILSTHPLMPQAWVQKLCYYVNSAPCDPRDPEFQRIVTDFANGMQWTALVRELMASPITTNATKTVTFATNAEVIAVSRRDHLCAQLNNRLGFYDICQLDAANQQGVGRSLITLIISGMPSDGYGRGGVIPVLPNEPTLFYRAGLENICAAVSAQLIDVKVDPKQPGAKHWSSTDPNGAIADFVALVIGLVPSDDRTADVTTTLSSHFTSAVAQGATPTDALRSTFVAACLSPSFIGIGM